MYYFSSVNVISECIASLIKNPYQGKLWFGILLGGAILAGFFVLQGIGLYQMAKKRGLKNKFFAFIPFVNILYIGKLAGESYFFGHKIKRASLYAMISQIFVLLLTCTMIVAETYIRVKVGAPQEGEYGLSWPQISGGLPGTVFKFYEISSYILPIFQLLFEIFFIVMVMGLYKKYAAKNYMTFSMLSLFVPLSRYVLIFVIRNNKAIDYEAYMRAQREAYMRRQQQYYNTSYNNPYNRYGNAPYGNGEYGVNQQRTEEPFSEFSSREKAGNPFEEFNKTDDFFN